MREGWFGQAKAGSTRESPALLTPARRAVNNSEMSVGRCAESRMEVTRPRLFFTHVLLAICLGAIALPSGVARGQSILDAVKYEELVVCLNNDGRFLAWDIKNGEFKPDLAAGLSKVKLARMGSNGKRIWGVQEKKLLEWSPGTKAWGEVAKFDAGGEELAGIAVVGEMSFLIFPRKVLSPIDRHTFEVPPTPGTIQRSQETPRPAVQPMDHVLSVVGFRRCRGVVVEWKLGLEDSPQGGESRDDRASLRSHSSVEEQCRRRVGSNPTRPCCVSLRFTCHDGSANGALD